MKILLCILLANAYALAPFAMVGAQTASVEDVVETKIVQEEKAAKRLLIGVSTRPLDEFLAGHLGIETGAGFVITSVAPDMPASAAGLQPNDLILKINDRSPATVETLREELTGKKPGDRLVLAGIRAGEKFKAELILGDHVAKNRPIEQDLLVEQARAKQLAIELEAEAKRKAEEAQKRKGLFSGNLLRSRREAAQAAEEAARARDMQAEAEARANKLRYARELELARRTEAMARLERHNSEVKERIDMSRKALEMQQIEMLKARQAFEAASQKERSLEQKESGMRAFETAQKALKEARLGLDKARAAQVKEEYAKAIEFLGKEGGKKGAVLLPGMYGEVRRSDSVDTRLQSIEERLARIEKMLIEMSRSRGDIR